MASKRISAGILLYRRPAAGLEVLLGHPGGPYFERRDDGVWTIPKGEVEPEENLLAVAEREFLEETGHPVPPGPRLELGSIVQRGGKTVHAWAVEGDLDVASAHSNLFEMEWPPGTGRIAFYPEIDRVSWLTPADARRLVKDAQFAFIERLEALLIGRT
ncbi:MAG TPA: NUDIX domain-containing protein [Candidatus Polarisedimenticolia bacterium]|nr:NUDIX domain-containing protein [Candidatus Polarisedimenticolia bacterium]